MLRRVLAYVLLFGLGSVVWFELDPRLKYNLDSDNYRWVGQAIYEPRFPIGTAFVGTSRVWTAVDTATIARAFPEDQPINLGTNWHGRQARWVVIRDLVNAKPIKRLVVEIFHFEEEDTHPYSRFLGAIDDPPLELWRELAMPAMLTDEQPKRLLSDLLGYYLSAWVRSYYLAFRKLWYGPFDSFSYPHWDRSLGHLQTSNTPEEQARFQATIAGEAPRYEVDPDSTRRIPERFLRRVSELCRERGIELYFLFVPGRNGPIPNQRYLEVLGRYGTPLILPLDGLYEARLWRDPSHFTAEGTAIFTRRLLESPLYRRRADTAIPASDQ